MLETQDRVIKSGKFAQIPLYPSTVQSCLVSMVAGSSLDLRLQGILFFSQLSLPCFLFSYSHLETEMGGPIGEILSPLPQPFEM